MALSSLIISIKADDMASSIIKSVAESVRSFAGEIGRVAFTNIINGARDATIALGKFQMELELTDIAFTQMIKGADRGMHSMEEYTKVAKAFRNELHDLAAETPFSFMSVNKAARQMMAYGFALHDIVPMLKNIGDAAAAFGSSPVVIDRIVRALGQIRTYGRLKGQELLQLTEAGVPAHQILAEELGLTREQLSRIADQQIPAEDAIKAILTGIQKRYEGMMEVQSRTLKGSIEAIRDNFLLVATQLTEDVYYEFSSGIQSFRRNLDQWKNMTRAYGWRGMFGRQVFYDKNEREVDVSKLSKEELQDKIQKGELRREFKSDRYVDKKGKLVNLTGLSQEEIAFKEAKGDITREGPLIPSDWQQFIFAFGDYILELIKRIKELGDAFGHLWNTLFGGTNGLSDVGYAIFRMINSFIVLGTTILGVVDSFVSFIDTMLEAGSTGNFLQAVIVGIFSALEAVAVVTLIEKFAMLIASFRVAIGFAGIIGVQFGVMIGLANLVGQSNEDAATGILVVGTALMIVANRAWLVGAAMLALNVILAPFRLLITGITVAWTTLVAVYTTVRTTILALITVFTTLRAAIIAGTAVSFALHTAVVALSLIFGGARIVHVALTAAVIAGTAAIIAARAAYAAFEVVVGALIGVILIFEGSATAATVALGLWRSVTAAATTITSVFSGAVTILSAVMTVARAKMLLFIGVIALIVTALYNAFDAVKQAVNALFNAIVNAFARLINWFLEKLSSWSKAAYDGFVDTFAAIGRSVSELLKRVFSSIWEDASTFVKGILQRLGPLGKLIEEIGTKVSNAWNAAVSPDGSMLGKFESFVTGLFTPKDIGGLDQYPDSYYNIEPIEPGEKNKKGKKDKNKGAKTNKANQSTEHTYTIPIGQAVAEFVTTLESIDQPFDSLVSNAYALSKGLSDANGNLTKEYFAGKVGTAENNSALHRWGSDYAPQKGDLIYLRDGSVAIYMGDGKVRTGAPGEVTKELVERMVAVPAQLSQSIQSVGDVSADFVKNISGNLEGSYYVRQQGSTDVSGLHNDAYKMLNLLSLLYHQKTGERLVVTEANDPTGRRHNPNSWHYVGQAIDINDSYDGATSNGFITTDYGSEGSVVGYLKDIIQRVGGRYLFEGDHLHVTIPDGTFNVAEANRIYQEISGNTNATPVNQVVSDMSTVLESFIQAIGLQESNGDYNLVNPNSGAFGKYQFMPSEWAHQATAAGLSANAEATPENQEIVAHHAIQSMYQDYLSMGATPQKAMEAIAIGWYAGHGNGERWVRGEPYPINDAGQPYSWTAPQGKYPSLVGYMQSVFSHMGEVGQNIPQQLQKIVEAQVKLNLTPIENIADQIEYIASISEATGGETFVKKVMQTQTQAKAMGEYYKVQEKTNKVLSEYNVYMQEANKQIALNDGTLTDYRKSLIDMRDSYFQSLGKVQKLLGEGLSPELATKMANKAKEVFDSTLKEFERKRTVQLNIEFKTNAARIAELNHDFDKSLRLQTEAAEESFAEEAFEYGKKHLIDASVVPQMVNEYLKTGSIESVNSPFSTSPYAESIAINGREAFDNMKNYIIAGLDEIEQKAQISAKTIYSRTVDSFAEQGDLKGYLQYMQNIADSADAIREAQYISNKNWIERLKEDFQYLGRETDQVMLTLHDSLINSGTDAITSFIKGTKSAKEAFQDFALSVMEAVVQMVIKMSLLKVIGGVFGGFFAGSGYVTKGESIGYVINGFRAKGGDVKKGEAYIVGEQGPEVFSPGQSGSIMSNNQLNSTLNNLERITSAGTMSNPQEGVPTTTVPPVVVNLDNKSGHQMEAEATSNFDGEKWIISVVMDAVRRNVNGMRSLIGNVPGKR